ncbi:MAG: 2-C-methyl-D-erythritol 4-phosphate cytidylyltransferase [Chitinispirillaceae bacterium]|nr:2-C-methyl-D-erythritol 4-phosphate cytidylyltransferase [Chitinispirillaceae bacterium]
MKEQVDAVIVAAGSGTRLGASVPKAFVPLCGSPLVSYSYSVFRTHPAIDNIVLVVPQQLIESSNEMFSDPRTMIVAGGKERWESAKNGIEASGADWVLIHDAARPFVSHKVIDSVLSLISNFDCGITATPEVDTIRTYTGNTAGETIDRSKLIRVGTPQLFKRDLLYQLIESAHTLSQIPTDEAMLFQAFGHTIGLAWGDPKNFKITTPEDFEIAEAIIAKNSMFLGR